MSKKKRFPVPEDEYNRPLRLSYPSFCSLKTFDSSVKAIRKVSTHLTEEPYFIITNSNWERLRNEIVSLAETCHKAFGEQSRHTDWLHNGDVCRLLNISKRTLQHYRDTGVLPFSQIGHKCYYRREDVELLLQTKSEKSKTDRIKKRQCTILLQENL